MFSVSKQILAVILSVVVLLSTLTVTVNMHFCGDFLVDTALYQSAEDCGMTIEKSIPDYEPHIRVKGCCQDVQVQHAGQDIYKSNQNLVVLNKFFWTTTIFRPDAPRSILSDENQLVISDYPPPAPLQPLFILHETWLI